MCSGGVGVRGECMVGGAGVRNVMVGCQFEFGIISLIHYNFHCTSKGNSVSMQNPV